MDDFSIWVNHDYQSCFKIDKVSFKFDRITVSDQILTHF